MIIVVIFITLSQLHVPCSKDDALAISIFEEEYKAGLKGCKNNLHGILILSKGSTPPKTYELRSKLSQVLVDVDLMHDLRDQILFERAGYAFFVDVVYERLPSFCSSCKIVGHSFESCKKRAKEVSRKLVDPKGEPRKKQIYVPKNKNKDHKVIQDDVVIRPGPSYTNNPEGHVSPPDLVDVVPQTQPEISDC
ncbi:hypothetical protein JHK82_035467 [Glycine max]|uniref:Zinc knuckle CX2CX4HX4C domain-containing protein n=2 Tax=Glycine subgen. Soja TaxID=1462606 RepID=A0A0R0GSZ0_SOYBN|nr:hypothetical protein JHK85_036185 [Glycine max]KAG4976122.1 hypothetical protein JHK86_035596 [Glycine max]KAG5112198.1 hypothetical protein JHK82_035467 [Glycine max]KAG5129476.1 hypothetical protein JHK84_035873 [Glycine max]RZB71157.1 hypothetical protein D0Y65_035895 [Glycine soja]